MKTLREAWVALAFVAGGFVVVGALYGSMPDTVPIHWNLRGEADGFAPKAVGAFLLPVTNVLVTALLLGVQRWARDRATIARFARVYAILVTALSGFFFVMTGLAALAAAGALVDITRWVVAAAGLLFAILGNFLGKLTRNRYAGIRTPWTLASDEVWLKTHRLGGKLFVAAGIATLIAVFVGGGMVVLLAGVLVTTVVSVVYSYLIHRAETAPSSERRDS